MEPTGQQKELFSERLRQRHEQDQAEAEKLISQLISELRNSLKEHVRTELTTTMGATKGKIEKEIEGLPEQIKDATIPLKAALEQAQQSVSTIKLLSSIWLKSFLIGSALIAALWLGMSWMGHEVQRLYTEISAAKATLAQLPEGVRFRQTPDGRKYIIAQTLGEPFKNSDGGMVVEVK